MFRFMATFLIFAAPMSAAHAGLFSPDPEVKEQRQELREARRYAKDFDKLSRKFDRATRRDNEEKLARLDREINQIARAELQKVGVSPGN